MKEEEGRKELGRSAGGDGRMLFDNFSRSM